MRNQHGTTIGFFVGWLELGGYAMVIAILARVVGIYGMTLYKSFGGYASISIPWLAAATVIVLLLSQIFKWGSIRTFNSIATYTTLALLFALGLYSLFNYHETMQAIPGALQTIKPLQLSSLLFSHFFR